MIDPRERPMHLRLLRGGAGALRLSADLVERARAALEAGVDLGSVIDALDRAGAIDREHVVEKAGTNEHAA